MKYIMTFENYGSLINIESKAKDIEEEKEKTTNLKREKEIQKMKNLKKEMDKELEEKSDGKEKVA